MVSPVPLLVCILVAASGTPARADVNHRLELRGFAGSVWDARKAGLFDNRFTKEPAACTSLVQAGTDAGLKPTDTFLDGGDNPVLWKRAGEVCADYAALRSLAKAIDDIAPHLRSVSAYTAQDGKPDPSVTGVAYRAVVDTAKTCVSVIDAAIKGGALADVKFAPNGNRSEPQLTLAEARTRCDRWIEFGTKAAKVDDERRANEQAALRAKWSKLGATGDRLKYLMAYGHHTIRGQGCTELAGNALKSSPVFYEVSESSTAWIVYKTEFKGDTQVRYTQRSYRKDAGWACK